MTARSLCLLSLLVSAIAAPDGLLAQGTTTPALTPAQEKREELKNQADSAYRNGNYAEAEKLLNQVLTEDAKDHVALYLRASSRVEQGGSTNDPSLVRKGVTDAINALKLDSNYDYYLPYLYGMSRLAEVEKRPEHARSGIETADKVLGMGKATPEQKANIYFQRSLLNQALGDFAGAKKDLQNAIAAQPAHLASVTALCNLVLQENNPQAAEKQFDAAVQAVPDEPIVYNNRGTFLQSQGRYDEALRDFNKAIERDAEYVPALTNRGYVQIMLHKYAAAEADLTHSLTADPQQPTAFALRAAARLHLGQVEGALQDYQTVVSLNPQNAAAHYDLGFAHFFHRDYPAAKEEFDRAMSLDSSIPFLAPWRYTAMVFSSQREEALVEFGALERKADTSRTWFDILTLFLMGKTTEEAVFAAVDKSNPTTEAMQTCEANYFVGLRYASRNQADKARQFFDKALTADQGHLAAYRGAMYAIGRFSTE